MHIWDFLQFGNNNIIYWKHLNKRLMSLPSVTLFSIHKPKSSNNHYTSGLKVFYFIQAIDVLTSSDPIMRLSHNRALRLARGYADRTPDDGSNGYACARPLFISNNRIPCTIYRTLNFTFAIRLLYTHI